MNYIPVTQEDLKQASILNNLIREGKFELKGDALQLAAIAQKWLITHIAALQNPVDISDKPEPRKKEK